MVSFWPWKGDDTASFEKALASLSESIKKANLKQDRLRTNSRRYKVLWTLYTSLAYLVSALVLVLVTGWQNWSAVEYTALAGAPVIIYAVRYALTAYYDYRLNSNQTYLDGLNQQRNDAIEKFKNATKFNSTQQLLQKYGAAPTQPSTLNSASTSAGKRKSGANDSLKQSTPQRTGLPPPPTANIRRPPSENLASDAAAVSQQPMPYPQQSPPRPQRPYSTTNSPISQDTSASFAPNAFTSAPSAPPQYSETSQRQWYDRLFDVILGEDETRASNRIALVCKHCKLVNGQAPPDIRRFEDVGRWRCAECRGWNGTDNEVHKILEVAKAGEASQEMLEKSKHISAEDDDLPEAGSPSESTYPAAEAEEDHPQSEANEAGKDGTELPERSTRSRKKKSEESP